MTRYRVLGDVGEAHMNSREIAFSWQVQHGGVGTLLLFPRSFKPLRRCGKDADGGRTDSRGHERNTRREC